MGTSQLPLNIRKKIISIVLWVIFVIHFSIVCVFIAPENPVSKKVQPFLLSYFQYCEQTWKMFAPPPDYNTKLYFQYSRIINGNREETIFYDVIKPFNESKVKHSTALPRISHFLFNCCHKLNQILKEKKQQLILLEDGDEKVSHQEEIWEQLERTTYHYALMHYGEKFYHQVDPWKSSGDGIGRDSIYFRYRIVQVQFPSFERRGLDFYDSKNCYMAFSDSDYHIINTLNAN